MHLAACVIDGRRHSHVSMPRRRSIEVLSNLCRHILQCRLTALSESKPADEEAEDRCSEDAKQWRDHCWKRPTGCARRRAARTTRHCHCLPRHCLPHVITVDPHVYPGLHNTPTNSSGGGRLIVRHGEIYRGRDCGAAARATHRISRFIPKPATPPSARSLRLPPKEPATARPSNGTNGPKRHVHWNASTQGGHAHCWWPRAMPLLICRSIDCRICRCLRLLDAPVTLVALLAAL